MFKHMNILMILTILFNKILIFKISEPKFFDFAHL